MRLKEIVEITKARPFSPNTDLNREVKSAFASDLMSDVLCQEVSQGLLITSLSNPQTLRTAEMAEISAVLMVGGKQPLPETLTLARELDIPLMGTELSMFEACGRLNHAGLPSCNPCDEETDLVSIPDRVE
jgi:predicted transcriptional regulator